MMKFNIFNWKTIEDFNTEFKNAYLEMYIDQDNNKNINWGYIGEDCTLFIDKSIFSYINGGYGFRGSYNSNIIFKNSEINFNIFLESIFGIDENNYNPIRNYNIENSIFNNNKGYNGVVFSIKTITMDGNQISFKNNTFINNSGFRGGVIYSLSPVAKSSVQFIDCIFNNNTAEEGSISYSYNIDSEPFINNKEYLIKFTNDIGINGFSTNPYYIRYVNESDINISLYSGDMLREVIELIKIDSDYNNFSIDDMIFFRIESPDESQIKLFGQISSYCLDSICRIPNFRVVGKPGTLNLRFFIIKYGSYKEFEKNYYDFSLTILPCNKSEYLNQDKDGINIESCYKPICEHSCNTGLCVNENVCNCDGTPYTGKYCNEYLKSERKKIIIYIALAIVIFIFFCIIFFSFGIYWYIYDPIIKA
eukprot:jgi/Orpsp1_1/1184098/evm.model.c7180000088000.1